MPEKRSRMLQPRASMRRRRRMFFSHVSLTCSSASGLDLLVDAPEVKAAKAVGVRTPPAADRIAEKTTVVAVIVRP